MFGTFTLLSVQCLIATRIKKQINLTKVDYLAILIQALATAIIFVSMEKMSFLVFTIALSLSLVCFGSTFNIMIYHYRRKTTRKYPYLYGAFNLFLFVMYCIIIASLRLMFG